MKNIIVAICVLLPGIFFAVLLNPFFDSKLEIGTKELVLKQKQNNKWEEIEQLVLSIKNSPPNGQIKLELCGLIDKQGNINTNLSPGLWRKIYEGIVVPDNESSLTMVGVKRLDNLEWAIRYVEEKNIPGAIIELGVARGGAMVFAKHVVNQLGSSRRVICADSFEGTGFSTFPQDADHNWMVGQIAYDVPYVKKQFDKYGLLDNNISFIKGFFEETLHKNKEVIGSIAILRVDCDLYGATYTCLKELYDSVSPGGVIIMDDYGLGADTAAKATEDFRRENNITNSIHYIDMSGIYWIKD